MKQYFIRYSIISCIVLLSYLVIDTLIAAGTFKNIVPHFNGEVDKINLPIAGPEDITIDQESGIALISVDDRRANLKSPGSVNGAILVMNLNDSSRSIRNVTPAEMIDFHPHGLSLFKNSDNRKILFVISHRIETPSHVVERFEWRNDSLFHLETISDETLMTSPNDLAGTGERSFYVTNDHYYTKGIGRVLEEYLRRSITYVNYYDGSVFKKVADGIPYANGIQMSTDTKTFYVASVTGRKILVYDRFNDNSLKLRSEIPVSTGADNIELDEKGNLLVGCHAQMLKFVAHASDPAKFSPTQIIRINSKDYSVEELFLNDGKAYSGGTVAAPYGNKFLVGSVFEPSMLMLKLKD